MPCKAAILTVENECSSVGRTKHVDVKLLFVNDNIRKGEIRV